MDSNPYASYECAGEIDHDRLTALQACGMLALSALLFITLPVSLPSLIAGACAWKSFDEKNGAFDVGFFTTTLILVPIATYYIYCPAIDWLRECILTLSS